MFMGSWNKKILIAVALIIIQVILYMVVMGRDSYTFSIPTFVICSIPGLAGAFIIWIEKIKDRF